MSPSAREILRDYRRLLEEVDAWFSRCRLRSADQMVCGSGCSGCCRGLFDITLLDAALLNSAFGSLEEPLRQTALEKAVRIGENLQGRWMGFASPYVLNDLPHDEWTQMEDDTPCVLLNDEGQCLLYEARPMTCRLHGLPHIDLSGEIFEADFCTLNFTGTDPLVLPQLRWEFRRLFERELALFQKFTHLLLGSPRNELDTFIPTALLIDFGSFSPKS
jgi:Fe-S-cluster containining protein